jgi:hypothetical protein
MQINFSLHASKFVKIPYSIGMEATQIPLIYSGRVRKALQLAEQAHRGQERKQGDVPYFLHLVAVAQVLTAAGVDDDLLCAAYLHDAAEDTSVNLARIEDEFGQRVARLVSGVTKRATDSEGNKLSREETHALTLSFMAEAEQDIAVLKAADLIANMTDLILDQRNHGYAHWGELFGAGADFKINHYLLLADILIGRLSHPTPWPFLVETLRERAGELRRLFVAWEQ